MTIKYVKLNDEHTEFATSLYTSKPPQIKRLNDDDLPEHHWFPVSENFDNLPDNDLYSQKLNSWEIVNGVVEITYTSELKDIETRRAVVDDRINEYRDQRLRKFLVFNGDRYDTTIESYQRITGAVLSAVIDSNFSTPWVTADNTTVTLTAADVIALGQAFAAFEGNTVLYAREMKDQVMVNDNPELFNIQQGWPTNEFGQSLEPESEPV